jgi:hypothetical protein
MKRNKPDPEWLAIMVTCMEVEDLDDGRLVAEVNKR